MLADRDRALIREHLAVFDHDWRYYAFTLGEPYLIRDRLVYFDGVFLYICAFSFRDIWEEATARDIHEIVVSRPEFARAQAVCVWGRFEPLEQVTIGSDDEARVLPSLNFSDYEPGFTDSVVDVAGFSYEQERKARLARNAVRRSGLSAQVVQREQLLAEHLALITEWRNTHEIAAVNASALVGIQAYVASGGAQLIECRCGGRLDGFVVMSAPAEDAAVYLAGFGRKGNGVRVGDGLYAAMLEFARERSLARLHVGYSASPELRSFKRKWGAHHDGPPFRECFFAESALVQSIIGSGRFRWQDRLFVDEVPLSWEAVQAS